VPENPNSRVRAGVTGVPAIMSQLAKLVEQVVQFLPTVR
jgi:hypothetical protein